jgi:hypothetical protein
MARKIGELFYELRASGESLQRDLKDGERQLTKFADFIRANPAVAIAGLTVAFAGVAFAAAKAAEQVEREFRPIVALLNLSAEAGVALRADMAAVASQTGEATLEIAQLFRTIADNGPGGAEKIRAVAEAAIALSQILGGGFSANAESLDAVLDLFGIDPSRARELAAALFDISAGRVPLGGLIETIKKVGPEVTALGLDFNTMAAFITKFLDKGYSVKQVSSLIKELADRGTEGREEIVKLAGATGDAAAQMARFNEQQERAQLGADALNKRVKNELNATWLEFGNKTLPVVTTSLAFLVGWLNGGTSGFTRFAAGAARAKAALDGLNGANVTAPTVPAVDPQGSGLGPDPELERIGKVIAKAQTDLRVIADLSASQLRNIDRQLKAVEAAATNETQTERIKALRLEIADNLPAALRRMSAEMARAENAVESFLSKADQLGAELDGTRALTAGADKIAAIKREATAAGVPVEIVRVEVERLEAALARFNARTAADEIKAFGDALAERAAALRESLDKEAALIALEKTEAAGRRARVADLEGEIAARAEGADAVEAFIKARRRAELVEQAIADARARAARAQRAATDEEIAGAKQYGNQLADLENQLAALNTTTGDGLLKTFGTLAAQATAIATSLGDGGKKLAQWAGLLGPLLTGFSGIGDALKGRDSAGNIVAGTSTSFLNALGGGNGKDSQAQALAGSVAVISAVVSIADSLDLFGTRAAEEARRMKEAARAFAQSLTDFVNSANPETGASAAITAARKRAEELAREAAAVVGGSATFAGPVDAATLRANAAELLAAAATMSDKKLADKLRTVAAGFIDVADGLDVVEQAARDAVLERLGDLGVRTLAAAGLTEEAAALRAQRAAQKELTEARRDETEEGRQYLAALEGVIAAEAAAAAAIAARTAILRELDNTLAILGGTAAEQLLVTVDRLGDAFPELAGLFDDLDLSTSEGLTAARDRLRDLYRELSADGVSEAEQPLVDAIRRILGGIDSAFAALPTLDPIADKLEAFAVRVEVFGLSAADQLAELLDIFSGAFDDLDDVLAGADTSSTAGLTAFASTLQQEIADILEGGITEEEEPRLAALRRLFAAVTATLDGIADAAETARQELVAAATSRVNNTIAINGLTGFDALDTRVKGLAGLSPALASLLPLFNDRSVDGIAATQTALRDMFRQITDGTFDVSQFGQLTEDEFIAAIIALSQELGGLSTSLLDAASATAAAAAAEREATQDLRIRQAAARGEDTRLAAFDEAARREREKAVTESRSLAYRQFLESVLADERNKLLADIAAESAATNTAAVDSVAPRGAQSSEFVRNVGSITEVTAQTIVSVLRQIETNTRAQYAGGLPTPPTVSARGGGGATFVFHFAAPAVTLAPNTTPQDYAAAYSRANTLAISQALGKLTRTNVNFLGGGAL